MARYSSAVSSTSCRHQPEGAGEEGHGGTRDVDQARPAADRAPDFADEFGEGRPFRTDGVGDAVVRLPRLGQAEVGQVIDMDAPDPVVASTADCEDREPAEQPGDVVEQDAVTAEEDGGANDGVGDVALGEGPLHLCLAPEIRQRRAAAGVRDAHVHDPLDPCPPGRVEQRPRVGDGQLVVDGATAEAHPVGVVERGCPRERRHQTQVVVEIQRSHVDRGPTRGPVRDAR